MKTFKPQIKHLTAIILMGFFILLFNGCSNEEKKTSKSFSGEEFIQVNELLYLLDFESETAFVQNGESIQDAVDAALPGDVIYIEPGTYREDIAVNSSNIKLIGLSYTPNDLLINNAKENNIDIIKLYDKSSIENHHQNFDNKEKENIISDFSRTELGGGIAHYRFKVRMGPGEFDVVGIHRVVRESRPFHPVPTKGDVFMVHGALTGFANTFLAKGLESVNDINAKTSAPFYLASKNIDVWGIDLGWTMIPAETTEFSFFEDWGFEKDIDHTLKALRIARTIRGITKQGFSNLNLLGYSSGATIAYGVANSETQQANMMKRNIKGLIPVDNAFKFENGENFGCVEANSHLDSFNSGVLENRWGEFFSLLGNLALTNPDSVSPIPDFEGLTNSRATRIVFSSPKDPDKGIFFHFFGGNVNEFLYSDENRIFRDAAGHSPFMPTKIFYEYNALNCSSSDGVSFDDHLELISVPIFYIGAGGGSGEAGYYTATLTASTDVTNHLVSLDDDPSKDFGHVDLWLGYNADKLVWSELSSWIVDHK
ncbi:MAG: hypothetical protein ABFR62_11320 [Bacteroidota bacterium]